MCLDCLSSYSQSTQRTILPLESAFYILNPSGDLIATQQRLSPRLSSFAIGLTQRLPPPPKSYPPSTPTPYISTLVMLVEKCTAPAKLPASECDKLGNYLVNGMFLRQIEVLGV